MNLKIPFFECPIIIHWSLSLFILFCSIAYPYYATIYIFIFLCVLLHEFGHLLGGKLVGVKCDKIMLHILGGGAFLQIRPDAPVKKIFPTILGGPLVSLILSLFFGILNYYFRNEYITFLFVINTVILCFNILPILPLDGGRLLKALFMYFGLHFVKASYYATRIGQLLATIIMGISIFYLDLASFSMMALVLFLSESEFKQSKTHFAYLIFTDITEDREACPLSEEDISTIKQLPKKEQKELLEALAADGFLYKI